MGASPTLQEEVAMLFVEESEALQPIPDVLPVPDATMQAIDTSDLHSVASHDERPARSPAVCHIPKLAPVTVKLTDPVDPVLIDETFG
jgi:hypothetical protein